VATFPRVAYALLVALCAFGWQYLLFKPHGLIVVLFLASWTVPMWNALWPKERFDWMPQVPRRGVVLGNL
jgi:hypothetical protein